MHLRLYLIPSFCLKRKLKRNGDQLRFKLLKNDFIICSYPSADSLFFSSLKSSLIDNFIDMIQLCSGNCFIMIVLYITIALVCQTTSLSCLDQTGQPVAWWVVLKVPPKSGTNSYGYYDSNMKTGQFQYINAMIDLSKSALTYTFDSFNEKEYDRVAWNDEKPNNQTSSTAAHSKGFIGFDLQNRSGFFFSHSIPKYPDFS